MVKIKLKSEHKTEILQSDLLNRRTLRREWRMRVCFGMRGVLKWFVSKRSEEEGMKQGIEE